MVSTAHEPRPTSAAELRAEDSAWAGHGSVGSECEGCDPIATAAR